MKIQRSYRLLFAAGLVLLAGCRPGAPATAPSPTHAGITEAPSTPPPTEAPATTTVPSSPTLPAATSARPTATPTDVPPTPEPSPTTAPEATYEGWAEYRQDHYGFAFRYPAGWVVEEDVPPSTMVDHGLWVRDPARPEVGLRVGFRRAGEEQQITPTGIGSGEIVSRGGVFFLGQTLRRDALVAQGNDVEVLYGGTGAVGRGDLEFFLRLHGDRLPGGETAPLAAEAQATADAIVASFRRLP